MTPALSESEYERQMLEDIMKVIKSPECKAVSKIDAHWMARKITALRAELDALKAAKGDRNV